MIKHFACKETRKVWEAIYSKKFPSEIQKIARRKLRMLNNSTNLYDLRFPPSNHLESLKGKRKEELSIRINKQWRICFTWKQNDSFNVKIEDYH